MRRGLWGAATVVLLLSLPLPAHADDPASARKAAQERANKAAARLAKAQTDLARAEDGIVDLQRRVERDEQQMGALRPPGRDPAPRGGMGGGAAGPPAFREGNKPAGRAGGPGKTGAPRARA